MDEFAELVMREIATRRAVSESNGTESFISGLKRAVVIALGQEGAERVFAAHGEAY